MGGAGFIDATYFWYKPALCMRDGRVRAHLSTDASAVAHLGGEFTRRKKRLWGFGTADEEEKKHSCENLASATGKIENHEEETQAN